MPINPNISLAVRPVEMQDPMALYGKVAAIQGAQNQNALAQYQLGAAQRAEAKDIARTNALAQAGSDDTAIANALLKAGDLKGYSDFLKTRSEGLKADTELLDARLKQSRSFLDTIDPSSPDAPQRYIAWHEANHRDPVIGKALAARGITADQARGNIMQAIQQGPAAFAQLLNQSKLGTEKFMEMNKPTTQVIDQSGQKTVLQSPGLGGAPTTVGTYADVPLPAAVEAQKSRIAKSGASNISVSTEKKYGERFGGLIADQDASKLTAAENAPQAAATADRILDIVEGGKVFTGTGANVRLQLAKALNLAGKTDAEKIKNTEILGASLAETTLGAIKSSNLGAGQGFTNADRDFLEKAKAGQISFDAGSLKELARLSRRAAEKSAESWNKRVQSIPGETLQGVGISTEPIVVQPRASKGAAEASNIPAAAISALKAGQGSREQFDAIFGAGAADRALGKGK